MHVSLLIVGAHDGQIKRDAILRAASQGAVILIEPVPHLFDKLSKNYAAFPGIICLNRCVAEESGIVNFFAPTIKAIEICPWGDQIGSMNSDHALRHKDALATQIVQIQVTAVTFSELMCTFNIVSIDTLFTDTEGFDAKLLPLFPFCKVRPRRIVFEYKHADGTFNIGRNLGRLLIMLDELGYDMQIADMENCVATLRRT